MKCLLLRKYIKFLNFFFVIFYKFSFNVFNNIFCLVLLNYKLFKSNIIISFLLDELIIVCLLVYIDYFICCIFISVDFFDEG